MFGVKRRRAHARRRPARGDPSHASESGMVTAELAAALPTLALILITAVWGISLASAQMRCTDAAREAARAAARGEERATVLQIAEAVAPERATVEIRHGDGLVTIEVQVTVGAPPPIGSTLTTTMRGEAVVLEERP